LFPDDKRANAIRPYGINSKSITMLEWVGMDKGFSQPYDTPI